MTSPDLALPILPIEPADPVDPVDPVDSLDDLDVVDSGPNWWLRIDPRRRRLLLVLVLVAVSGAFSALWAMPSRLDTGGDAAAYAGVARNIHDGKGVTSPFVNEFDGLSPEDAVAQLGHSPLLLWPPLFPMTLAAGRWIGLDPDATARLVNLLSVMAAGVLAAALAYRLSRRSTVAALASGLLLVFSQPVGSAVIASYSDAFFLAVSLAAVHVLVNAVRRPNPVTVGGFIVLAAAAAMTRYVGLGLVLGGAAALVVSGRGRARWWSGGAALLAAVPAIWWMRAARAQVANPIGTARFQPRTDLFSNAISTAADWLGPSFLPGWWRVASIDAGLAVLVLAGVLLGISAYVRRGSGRRRITALRAAWTAASLAAAGLLLVLIVSAGTIGAGIVLNGRMLLPVQGVVVPMACAAVALSVRTLRDRSQSRSRACAVRVLIGAATAIVVVGVIVSGVHNADQPAPSLGAASAPGDAEAVPRTLGDRQVVFSDAPSQLYALAGTSSAMVPRRTLASTGEANPDFDRQLVDLRRLLRERNGAVVLFSAVQVFTEDPLTEDDLLQAGGFEVIPVSPLVHVVLVKR